MTFALDFEHGDRGWAAQHPDTGQIIRPSIIQGLGLEVTDEKHAFKPGEVMLLLLMSRTFILAVPPGIIDQIDAGGIDLYVAEETTNWRMWTAMPMWGLEVDPFDMYGRPDIADIWRLDTSSASFNIVTEVETIVQNGLRGGESLFRLVKAILHPEAIHSNREIPAALRPIVEELGREFFTAVAINTDAIQRWLEERLRSELRQFQAIRYKVREEDFTRLLPVHPKGKRMPKALAEMTFSELTRMLWRAVVQRASQRSLAVPDELLKNPPASWREKSATQRAKRAEKSEKTTARPPSAKETAAPKGPTGPASKPAGRKPAKGRLYPDGQGEGKVQSSDHVRAQIARLRATGRKKDAAQADRLEQLLKAAEPKVKTRLVKCVCGKRHRVGANFEGDLAECPKAA